MKTDLLVHPFPALYWENSRVLILGSFPSAVSRSQQFYYANHTNRFWGLMSILYDDPEPDHRLFCKMHEIALWDVIASCRITGSSDSSIHDVTCNDIASLTDKTDIQAVFTTGKLASKLYDTYVKCDRKHISLPSTSAANAAMRMNDLLKYYAVIKEYTDE